MTEFVNKYRDLTSWVHFPEDSALGTH